MAPERPRARRRVILVIAAAATALAFAVRLAWVLEVQSPFTAVYSDMGGYYYRAVALLAGQPPTDPRFNAFYPWGTHTLLALELKAIGQSRLGIGLVQSAVGAIPAGCAAFLAARLDPRPFVVALAAFAVALWHPQITYAAFFMSEIWFTAAIMLATTLFLRALGLGARARGTPWSALGSGVATAVAFVVRPQILLTCALVGLLLLGPVVRRLRRRGLAATLRDGRPWLLFAAPLVLAIGGSAVRLYRVSGHLGLISENGAVQRLFADTDVGRIESSWATPSGAPMSAWFSPGPKHPLPAGSIVRFEGYIADPVILERIRRERVRGVPFRVRVGRALHNIALLAWKNVPNPEQDFRYTPWRAKLQEAFVTATLVLVPLALAGLWASRRRCARAAALVVIANLATIVYVAAFYYAEARYRVSYDPFLVVAAVVGAAFLSRRLRKTSKLLAHRLRPRSP